MPALGKVKEQAKVVVCAAGLHNASQALITYANDFKGYLPHLGVLQLPSGPVTPSSVGNYVCECSFGLMVRDPYGYNYGAGYLPDAESLICPGDKDGNYEAQYSYQPRAKGHFFGGVRMSYVYTYFNAEDTTEPGLATIPNYRFEKARGNRVVMLDRGDWYYFNAANEVAMAVITPQYHSKGANTLHLNGQVNFARSNEFQEKYLDTIQITTLFPGGPDDGIWFWNWRFEVLDKM